MKSTIKLFLLLLLILNHTTSAYSQDFEPIYNSDLKKLELNTSSENNVEEASTKKITLKERFKKFVIGEPTGFTPELYDCPYINKIGPSYMQGFYGSNGWNDHNIYHPYIRGSF